MKAVALLALVLLPLLAGAARAPPPTDRAYLWVTTDRAEAETYAPFYVLVDSKTWDVNATGNATLVPNPGYVNITVLDVTHNVSVGSHVVPLVYGKASDRWVVGEAWTSATLNITVRDLEHGLVGHATVRTVMSDEYLVWSIRRDFLAMHEATIAGILAKDAADDALLIAVGVAATLSFSVMWAAFFLRVEHRKARRHHLSSMWDRCADRVWPYTFVPDDTPVLLDPHRTWNKDFANLWRAREVEARCRDLDREIVEIRREQDRFRKGLTDL